MQPIRWFSVLSLVVLLGLVLAPATQSQARESSAALTRSLGTLDPLAHHPWTAQSNQDFADFGISVGTAGDVNGDGYDDVIVGGLVAYVYLGSATGLSSTPDWTSTTGDGVSVGTAGDVNGDGYDDVIVGGPGGIVYLGSATGLSSTADWSGSVGYGHAVSTAGDVNGDGYDDVIVGDLTYPGITEGKAWVYHGSAAGLSASPDWTGEDTSSTEYGAEYGNGVDSAGDVNGDGYADVIVGERLWADPCTDHDGRALAYYGSAGGLSITADWTFDGCGSAIGWSVGGAGDVNADGYGDVLVGAPYANELCCYDWTGQVWLFMGSATGLDGSAWSHEGQQLDSYYAWSVRSAGDVNGDGASDVIVGAPQYSDGQFSEGGAIVYRRP